MSGRPFHQLHRVLASLTVGRVRGEQKRERQLLEMGYGESMQHYQFKVSGNAMLLPDPALEQGVTITFDYPFHYAPGNRDSDLDFPQFWFGFESADPVYMLPRVKEWEVDAANGAITGAQVMVVAFGDDRDFTGTIHVTFQGYASPSDSANDV